MPYIDGESRTEVQESINNLRDAILRAVDQGEGGVEGILNFTITSLLDSVPQSNYSKWRYKYINAVVGILECVKLEFYRRLASPYEENAILKNGDLPIYEEIENDN